MFVPLTPVEFKRRAVTLFGSVTGVVDGERRFTYAEFGERADRLASALLSAGLQPGDRVAYLAYNSYPLLEGYYGVVEAGGVLMPLNIRLAPAELAYILNDASPTFLLADADFAPVVDAILSQVEIRPQVWWLTRRPEGRREPLYDDLIDSSSPLRVDRFEPDENAVAELFYTSGTTSRPKGVMLTHRSLYLHTLSSMPCLNISQSTVILHSIPLFHVNGWGTPQTVTAAGGRHVMLRRFDPAELMRLVEEECVTNFLAVPAMLSMILNHPAFGSRDLSSLETISLGGAPTPPELIARAEEAFGCRVIAGYGLTETSPVLTFSGDILGLADLGSEERIRRQATAGRPLIGVDLRIVDAENRELPWNGEDAGEIVVRSNLVMEGYWNDPEATDSVIQDGWFHTGDVGVIDPDGTVRIVDRMKDMIISGGENISSAEVEKVLFEHPAVMEVTVFGVPDERWGEVPFAIVVPMIDAQVEASELLSFCRERLASYKVPSRIEFRPELPHGGTGKVLKAQLREPYWQGRETEPPRRLTSSAQ